MKFKTTSNSVSPNYTFLTKVFKNRACAAHHTNLTLD